MEVIFYNKEVVDEFLIDILNRHKIYDMDCYVDGTSIYLEDEDAMWIDDEVYDFFMKDLFIFTDNSEIPDLLTKEEFITFCRIFHRIVE